MITIDGVAYDVPVIKLTRTADFLDRYAERTEDGILHRDLIGVYFNYKISFGRPSDMSEYQDLWDALTEPTPFHTVIVPDETGNYTFTAYFSNVGDELIKQKNGVNYWKNLTVNFIAKSPERTP